MSLKHLNFSKTKSYLVDEDYLATYSYVLLQLINTQFSGLYLCDIAPPCKIVNVSLYKKKQILRRKGLTSLLTRYE